MKPGLKIGMIAILFLAAGFLSWRALRPAAGGNSVDAPEGTRWICSDASCGADFALTVAELAAHYQKNADADPPCPKCGKTAIRAIACPNCGKTIPKPSRSTRGHDAATCPKCGKPLRSANGSSSR